MQARVITTDVKGKLTTGQLTATTLREGSRFRGRLIFEPLQGASETVDCEDSDATEHEALARAGAFGMNRFPPGG